MNTTNLNTFITVMHTKSISGAANQLYITQPAVSKRIKSLEEEFGVRLFDTVGRHIVPTEYANTLLSYAEKWLTDYEICKADLHHAKKTITGKLVIGTSHHIGSHYLPMVLNQFIQTYPDVQIDARVMDSETAHKAVLNGEVSLAFLTLPLVFNERLLYHTLWSDSLHFVTSILSPLAKESNVTLSTLAQSPAVLPSIDTFTSQITLAAFTKHKLHPYAKMSANPLESIRMMVAIGMGWSALPESLISSDLVKIDMQEHPELQRRLGVVVNPNLTHSPSTQALLKALPINN